MIVKPNGYDQARAITGESYFIPGGGYVCKILSAGEVKNNLDQNVLILTLDIAEGKYKDFFSDAYNTGKRKKWDCYYRQVIDEQNAALLKGLISCIDGGSKLKWPLPTEKLESKLCGFIFRRYEFMGANSGGVTIIRPIQPRSIETIRSGLYLIPPTLYLNDTTKGSGNSFEYF